MKTILVAIGCFLCVSMAVFAESTQSPEPQADLKRIQTAVLHIFDANEQFATQKNAEYFQPFTQAQKPLATVVSCSDSRVHMHAFDISPDNDLFVIRNIGNQLNTAEGSVEYGVHHLHTPLLLIVGHSACGAVTAALGDYSKESDAVQRELKTINVIKGGEITKNVIINVNNQVETALNKFRAEVKGGSLAIMGVVYDFRNDLKFGQGRITVVNLNGETNPDKIRESELLTGIKNIYVYQDK
jgi:carbonic anhydrase